jgi:hypothetical protein
MKRKLNFELVPDGCWYSNLRSILSPKDWNMIKKDAKVRSGGECTICGKKTDKLDAHEVWSYDIEKGIQKLENVISVCKDCHSVIHIGYTQLKGNIERAEQHYLKVNNCTYSEYRQDLNKANLLHKERNKVSEWKLDLTWLKRYLDS